MKAEPWPWPADTALDRARRVAQIYRHVLYEVNPTRCDLIDESSRRLGQNWVVPTVAQYTEDDLLTAELAADAMNVRIRTIYAWRTRGLTVTPTVDGPRYRMADLQEFDAARRRNRVTDHPKGK